MIAHLTTTNFTDVLLVSHGGLIQVLVALLCPKKNAILGYCDVVCFELKDEQWVNVPL